MSDNVPDRVDDGGLVDGSECDLGELPPSFPPTGVDYYNVTPPIGEKPYDEFNRFERRAVILDRMVKAGHPKALGSSQNELADEFGVSQPVISRDISILGEFVADEVGHDHVSIADTVFRGAILDLVEDGKKAWAAQLAKEWYDWLADMGEIERVADRVDMNVDVNADESEVYEVVPDDGAIEAEYEDVDDDGEDVEA